MTKTVISGNSKITFTVVKNPTPEDKKEKKK